MTELVTNKTATITSVGNFNILVKSWYHVDENGMRPDELKIGDNVNIKVFSDDTVPGKLYSKITRIDRSYTTVLGNIIHDMTSPDYVMKKDRYRIEFKSITR